jgi:hypothetical protein
MNKLNGQCPECRKPAPFCDCSEELSIKIFKKYSRKGYKHYTENTIEELDELPLNNHHIITEFAHLCEWLRVNHGIWVSVSVFVKRDYSVIWVYDIFKNSYITEQLQRFKGFSSSQEAYSNAFDYILNNNLI